MTVEVPDGLIAFLGYWIPLTLGVVLGLWLGYILWGG